MNAALPGLLPLVCPRCHARTERGRELFTLRLAERIRDQEGDGDEVLEGALACENPACGRRYPIVHGIPIIVAEPAPFVARQIASVVEGDLAPATAALLAEPGPDGEAWPQLLEHLSIYMDAHWGDRADPPPDGPSPRFGFEAIAERLRARAEARVPRAVELGASVGRGLAELHRGADLVVGVDRHFGALRRARSLLRGETVGYARRIVGRRYHPATARAGDLAPADRRMGAEVALLCADVLDPPLVPGTFDRVVALNVLDSVRSPDGLLSVIDGLCAPGGEAIVASPYSWQSGVVDEEGRIGGDDPAAEVGRRLREGAGLEATYTVEEEGDLPWWLRRDARSVQRYSAHYLRARKASTGAA